MSYYGVECFGHYQLNKWKHKSMHCGYKKKITLETSRATMDLYAGVSDTIVKVPTIKKEGVQLKLNF